MKTSLKISSLLIFLLILPNLTGAQDKKTSSKNPFENFKISAMPAKTIRSLKTATFGDKIFKALKANLESKKYKIGSTDKDFFLISGKTMSKEKAVDITIEFYSFINQAKSNAMISVVKSGSKILYSSAIILTDIKSINTWREFVVKEGKKKAGQVTQFVEEAADKTKQFMQCWGESMVNGPCKDLCSIATIMGCVGAATAIGTMVGTAVAAVAAIPTAGVSAVAVPVSALVGTFGGFVGCLGLVCGPCAFGSFLTCAALFL